MAEKRIQPKAAGAESAPRATAAAGVQKKSLSKRPAQEEHEEGRQARSTRFKRNKISPNRPGSPGLFCFTDPEGRVAIVTAKW